MQNVDHLLKVCQSGGKVCIPGPPGEPGPRGEKGSQGKRGQKGRRGSQGPPGIMGPPGRSGKQGIVGPPGPRGGMGLVGPQGPMGPPGRPGESISAPHVIISPAALTVNESSSARFLCSVSGNPPPRINWTRVGSSFPVGRAQRIGNMLVIRDVRLQDTGTYMCSAKNLLGNAENLTRLAVQGWCFDVKSIIMVAWCAPQCTEPWLGNRPIAFWQRRIGHLLQLS